jgi:cardiolipin synthase
LRYKHREATSAVLWIFIVFSFPFLGPLLYFLFGINRVQIKGLNIEAARKKLLDHPGSDAAIVLRRRSESICTFGNPGWPEHQAKAGQTLNRELFDMPSLGGNEVSLLRNGDEAYPAMIEAIQEAVSSIHFQTYIMRPDRVGKRFMEGLARAARKGISVRFLYDRLGSSLAHLSGFFNSYDSKPTMQIAGYSVIHPLKRRFQLNLRNHRKLLVVDGRIGFLGGINIHDENTTRGGNPPQVSDCHFEVRGPVVYELQYSFLQDWHFTTEENPGRLLQEEYFPVPAQQGEDYARVIRSGPGTDYEAIHRVFFTCMVMAQSSIKLMTPYFIPDPPLLTALKNAASRGVDVKLVLPERNNHWYLQFAARSFYETLLESGVRIFERPPPFSHTKALLVDNYWAVIGSANFDIRSFRLNFDLNMEVTGPFSEQTLRSFLDEEIVLSREVALKEFEQRRKWTTLLEDLCALASPIL